MNKPKSINEIIKNEFSVSEEDLKVAVKNSKRLIDDHHQIEFLKNNAPWKDERPFKPIDIYKDHYDLSNKTIFGVEPMTRLETKLIRIILASSGNQTEIPFHMTISDLSKILGLNNHKNYDKLYKAAWSLSKRQLFIEDEYGWAAYNWIAYIQYRKGEIEIKLNDSIKNLLPDYSNGHYTKLSLPMILTFKRKHSIHIYEGIVAKIRKNSKILASNFNRGDVVPISFNIKELRSLTASLYIYKSVTDFKRKVIEPSIEEISDVSDFWILKYTADKIASSKTNVFTFYVQKKQNFNTPSFSNDKLNLLENIESVEIIPDDDFSSDYIIKTFDINHCKYTIDNIDYLAQNHTKESFIKDFKKAKPLAKSDITNYMVSILENREMNEHPLKDDEEEMFNEVVKFWNDYSLERETDGLLHCNQIRRKSKKMQRLFKKLLEHDVSIPEIKMTIEIANDSPYFCKYFNNFSYFLVYDNFVGIESGNYKVDGTEFAYMNAMTEY